MKKFNLIAMLLVVMLTVAGCGGTSAGGTTPDPKGKSGETEKKAQGDVVIKHWQHHSEARLTMVQEFAEEFMKANPGIKIEIESIPFEQYQDKLVVTLATGDGPDVLQIQGGAFQELKTANYLQPLDESVMPTKDIENAFTESTVAPMKMDGKFYGLPTDVQTMLLFYNKQLLKEAGYSNPPQNFDELREYAKKMTKMDGDTLQVAGMGMAGYHPAVTSLMVQNGVKLVDENGKFAFNSPEGAEVYGMLQALIVNDKVFSPTFMKEWEAFRNSKSAMGLGHPAMIGNLKQTAPNVDFGVAMFPGIKGSHKTTVTNWGYALAKKANAEAGTKWINYLTSEEAQMKWTKKTGELPARKVLLESQELRADDKIAIALDSLKESETSPLQRPVYDTIMKKTWEKAVIEKKSAQEALDFAVEELNKATK